MSSLLNLSCQFVPAVLDEPAAYDVHKLGLLFDRQFVDGIQQLCETHQALLLGAPAQYSAEGKGTLIHTAERLVLAARRNRSVLALLREELARLVAEDEAYEAAKRAALERLARGAHLGGGPLPPRDELHERARLR